MQVCLHSQTHDQQYIMTSELTNYYYFHLTADSSGEPELVPANAPWYFQAAADAAILSRKQTSIFPQLIATD